MDDMTGDTSMNELLSLTTNIVVGYVSNNAVEPSSLASLIEQVHKTLSGVGQVVESSNKLVPAVPIKKSVFPTYIVCLEDGRQLKMIKRHLRIAYGMTPDQYRERWGLPPDYPMVAPEYGARRSEIAKSLGLGHKKAAPLEIEVIAPKKRGRPKTVAS